jgi:hypothetical protein
MTTAEGITYEAASGACYHATHTKANAFHAHRFPVVLDDMAIWLSYGRVVWVPHGTNSRGMTKMKRVLELARDITRHAL